MTTNLRGSPELKARLKALKQSFKPMGRQWATDTADLSRQAVTVRTGRGRASIRVKNATQTRATVSALWYIGILDQGAKAHLERPRKARAMVFTGRTGTIFTAKVAKPAQKGRGFAARAAQDALRRHPLSEALIGAWNGAA